MRAATTLIIAILLFFGCGSSQKGQQSRVDGSTDLAVAVDHEADTQTNETTVTESATDTTRRIETINTVYDTTKPVDPATGKPPVLSEMKKVEEENTNAKSKAQADKIETVSENAKTDLVITETLHEEQVVEETVVESQKPKWIAIITICLTVLCLFVLAKNILKKIPGIKTF